MLFKPPLSYEDLHAIGERNKGNKDVVALLWEIKRLHGIVARAHQIVRTIPPNPDAGSLGMISWALWHQIQDDPVVKEWLEIGK